jgi:hypothetical protein
MPDQVRPLTGDLEGVASRHMASWRRALSFQELHRCGYANFAEPGRSSPLNPSPRSRGTQPP